MSLSGKIFVQHWTGKIAQGIEGFSLWPSYLVVIWAKWGWTLVEELPQPLEYGGQFLASSSRWLQLQEVGGALSFVHLSFHRLIFLGVSSVCVRCFKVPKVGSLQFCWAPCWWEEGSCPSTLEMLKAEAGNTQRLHFICYLDYYRVPPPKALGSLRKNSDLFQDTNTRPIKAKMVSGRRAERSAVEGRAEKLGDLHEAHVYHQAYKCSSISPTSFVKTTQASITTAISTSNSTRATFADAPLALMLQFASPSPAVSWQGLVHRQPSRFSFSCWKELRLEQDYLWTEALPTAGRGESTCSGLWEVWGYFTV